MGEAQTGDPVNIEPPIPQPENTELSQAAEYLTKSYKHLGWFRDTSRPPVYSPRKYDLEFLQETAQQFPNYAQTLQDLNDVLGIFRSKLDKNNGNILHIYMFDKSTQKDPIYFLLGDIILARAGTTRNMSQMISREKLLPHRDAVFNEAGITLDELNNLDHTAEDSSRIPGKFPWEKTVDDSMFEFRQKEKLKDDFLKGIFSKVLAGQIQVPKKQSETVSPPSSTTKPTIT